MDRFIVISNEDLKENLRLKSNMDRFIEVYIYSIIILVIV